MTAAARKTIGLTIDLTGLPGEGSWYFADPVEGSQFCPIPIESPEFAGWVILGRTPGVHFFSAWFDLDLFDSGDQWRRGQFHVRPYDAFCHIRQYLRACIRIERRVSIAGIRAELALLKEESEGLGIAPDERAGLVNLARHFTAALARLLGLMPCVDADPGASQSTAIMAAGGKSAYFAPLN